MSDSVVVKCLRLTNLLSYGPDTGTIALGPLNVLIGPNAAGKSNLIEALSLLKSAPRDLAQAIRAGGGIREWLWKGSADPRQAGLDVVLTNPRGALSIRHRLVFAEVGQRFEIVDEAIENEHPHGGQSDAYFFYRYQGGSPAVNVAGGDRRFLRHEDVNSTASVLSQLRDPNQYPELTYVGQVYDRVMIYQDWNLGRGTAPRQPQPADLENTFLLPDASNLALVLNRLEQWPLVRGRLVEQLRDLYPRCRDYRVQVEGGTAQLFLEEEGLHQTVPATRLSDGMLRFLCLLAVLCHPQPPPLICLEEPELGLHPDVLPVVGRLLVEASERTQLIVTTHSDALLSADCLEPEHVLICEREETRTTLRRLDRAALQEWLDDYSLGDLWRMGQIGGTRY